MTSSEPFPGALSFCLDSLIKSQQQQRRSGGGRGRGRGRRTGGGGGDGTEAAGGIGGGGGGRGRRGNRQNRQQAQPYQPRMPRGNVNGNWSHDLFGAGAAQVVAVAPAAVAHSGPIYRALRSSKLHISNLDAGVSDEDIMELFGKFGALKKAFVNYDKAGRSLGTAEVVYTDVTAAVAAVNEYNGVMLDGKPMQIELIADASAATAAAIAPAYLPQPQPVVYQQVVRRTARGGGGSGGGGGYRDYNDSDNDNSGGDGGGRRGGRGGRGRGRGGRGRGDGGGGKSEEAEPTADVLDAAMDKYIGQAPGGETANLDAALEAYKAKAAS